MTNTHLDRSPTENARELTIDTRMTDNAREQTIDTRMKQRDSRIELISSDPNKSDMLGLLQVEAIRGTPAASARNRYWKLPSRYSPLRWHFELTYPVQYFEFCL
jgi:hypothetical protein